MTDEEILEKALKKAIRNRFKLNGRSKIGIDYSKISQEHAKLTIEPLGGKKGAYWPLACYQVNTVIFSHEFAKAFFPTTSEYLGEQAGWSNETKEGASLYIDYDWKFHLQQMVLEENPLLYLAKYL